MTAPPRLDLSRFSGSSIAEELAAQEAEFRELEVALARAREEGDRLKEAEEVVEVPAVEIEAAPTMAELMALTDQEPPGQTCAACGADPYALRSQYITCQCGEVYHTTCVGLRPIPFKGTTKTDRRNRDLFVKRYFSDWRCNKCKKNHAEPSPGGNPDDTTTQDDDDDDDDKKEMVVPEGLCSACHVDAPRERSQLLTCATCTMAFHTSCLKLRRIPFSNIPAERSHRRRFISRHYANWSCPACTASVEKDPQPLADPSPAPQSLVVRLDDVLAILQSRVAERDHLWQQRRPGLGNDVPDLATFLSTIDADLRPRAVPSDAVLKP